VKKAAGAGETACPTIDSTQPALVAQAVSPADFDFFTASDGRQKTIVHRTRLAGFFTFNCQLLTVN
jgi:hypothetical protein